MSNTIERVILVRGSKVYREKFGKQPRHRDHDVSEEYYKAPRPEGPKHRKIDSKPKHLLWTY